MTHTLCPRTRRLACYLRSSGFGHGASRAMCRDRYGIARGAGLAALLTLASASNPLSASADDPYPIVRDVYLMGTRATLATYDRDRSSGLARLERLLDILEETDRELSTWKNDSALIRVNRAPAGIPHQLSPRLCSLVHTLAYWQRETGGAFDPAIGSLIDAYDLRGAGRRPSRQSLARARERAGLEHVRFDRETCMVSLDEETRLEEGAFGKGEALARAIGSIAPRDTTPVMINLGGQIAVLGRPPRTSGWTIGIAHPLRRDQVRLTITLVEGSLSTSGGSERDRHPKGERIGHILDPRTGTPAPFAGSVSVWHERALVADILSTALYVMGPTDGLSWANAREVAACFLAPSPNGRGRGPVEVRVSRAWARRFPATVPSLDPVTASPDEPLTGSPAR